MSKADDQRDRLAKLAADTTEPDTSDIAEAPPGAWVSAEVGRFYRPREETVTIHLDTNTLDWFRETSQSGYLAAITAALRDHVARSRRE